MKSVLGISCFNLLCVFQFLLLICPINSFSQQKKVSSDNAPQNTASGVVAAIRSSAVSGDAKSQCDLGFMYNTGMGVTKDYTEAIKWFRKAADQGHATAQFNLGAMYRKGQGVTQDFAEAYKWFRKAADQGDANAQYSIGTIYDNGQGVTQDFAEAAKWYEKAADQGHAIAQYNLGAMYAKGEGVTEDFVEAYKWFNILAAKGDTAVVQVRDVLLRRMTPQQISEGQRKAREWTPKTESTAK